MLKFVLNVEQIKAAADVMRKGGLVIFPTETVYGLGTSLYSDKGIQAIYDLKERPKEKSLAILISDIGQLKGILAEIPKEFSILYKHFFPGPLTILLSKQASFRSKVSDNPLIGVRMPRHSIPIKLIESLGHPMVATSVNYSGSNPENFVSRIPKKLVSSAAFVFEDNGAVSGSASTVVSLNPLKIVRAGEIREDQIRKLLMM